MPTILTCQTGLTGVKLDLKSNGFCLRHVDARGRRDGLEELRLDEVELGLLKRLTRKMWRMGKTGYACVSGSVMLTRTALV